ncbi:MAG TPA: hypothetical protein VGX22_10485 [Candidatus Dormibacteraeota bacterium]|nr:hypothetical protein [Candidatus Dormibacteraeota bacterium]
MIRVLAVAVIVLVAAYFVMRALAAACTGSACDVYIPISLLLPLLIFIASAVTAVAAIASARGLGAWFAILIISTVLAVMGPIVALVVFKDSPDAFVATGTVLELQLAVVALVYTYIRTRPASSR